jgi:glycosyltransferase involved in cell wall biosynthesis
MGIRLGLLCTLADVHARKWAMALQQEGVEIYWYSPEPGISPPGITLRIAPRSPHKSWRYIDFWRTAGWLKKKLKEDKISLVMALHLTPFGTWAWLSGFRPFWGFALGADIFEYTLKNPEVRTYSGKKSGLFFRTLWFRWMVSKVINSAELILPDNNILLQELIRWKPQSLSKLFLFTWGIALSDWEPISLSQKINIRKENGWPENKFMVIIPRGFSPVYQTDKIIQAIMNIPPGKLSEVFWIISPGPYASNPEQIENWRKLLPSNARILDKSYPPEKWNNILKSMDALISVPRYDGFSSLLAEGAQAGLFLICSNWQGYAETKLNRAIISKFTAEELIQILKNWINSDELIKRKLISENQQIIQQSADLEKNTSLFIQHLKSIQNK